MAEELPQVRPGPRPWFVRRQAPPQAESAGGRLYEYDPRTTALSQTYVCERKVKKSLSQRIHSCECGVVADRDLFSAFLGLYVKPREDIDTLDAGSGQHGILHPPRPRWGSRRRGARLAPRSSESTGAVPRGTARWYGSPSAFQGDPT
ncbi:hypothetical protein B1A_06681 [mine drainage metagenome]|uniref:Transposase n=1 Tax=mine drainage metagenome TaxID=410659 RepID=T1CMT3_9ZZZZ